MTRADPGELRRLFLFDSLDETQLAWLADHGGVRTFAEGELLCAQGEPAEEFYVLLDGEISMFHLVRNAELELNRDSRPGLYGGAVQAYIGDRIEQIYPHSLRATRPARVFVLPARSFAQAVREWFPMATHLLEGVFFGMTTVRHVVDQRERLTALGTLTAGLTHELNNPAAAVSRASAELGDRLLASQRRLADLARQGVDCERIGALVSLHERLTGAGAAQPGRDPLAVSDAEDELGDWLDEHGVPDGWDVAPGLVAAGFGVAEAEQVAEAAGDRLPAAIGWLAEVLEVAQLQAEIAEASGRITALLDSARQYSQLDRAAAGDADLAELLESTLTMLRRKIAPDVRVVTDYAAGLPRVPCFPAELNQVWTNLVVNALDAMGGHGTLTVRAFRENDHAVVEIGDTGGGVPEEDLGRIFTPFFTTKPVGQGTGLGLDISWRIVVGRHGGDLTVESRPGDTRFRVRLPLAGQPRPNASR
ncbi:sensor histidine kinase [Actinomadura flavalba]|uniref:sensor histidine kinase n=1 Tax=Actinomadura flavalba TaxID=1120938 RepID=UPI000375C5DF|nr:ATP-binding protein [Actinomadura flavalba]